MLDVKTSGSALKPSPVHVSWGPQTLRLRDEEMFGISTAGAELCGRFLVRAFSVEEVHTVDIDRSCATALIHFEGGRQRADLLQHLALALRGNAEPAPGRQAVVLLASDLSRPRLKIHRNRGMLSTWEIVGEQPGVLCLRHETVTADAALGQRIAHQLESVHGVKSSVLRPFSGTLRIRFDPSQTRPTACCAPSRPRPSRCRSSSAPAVRAHRCGLAW